VPHLDASALDRDVDGVALLAAALGIPVPQPVRLSRLVTPRRGAHVLVVESDRLLRESIATQLHVQGHTVLEADTGEQALAAILGGKDLDVLLTETAMTSGPDGWALAEHARLQFPSVSVIYTSAQPRRLGREASGSVFVEKPYRTEQVIETVQELMLRVRGLGDADQHAEVASTPQPLAAAA
jgi:CheY-like chemotaxis protein